MVRQFFSNFKLISTKFSLFFLSSQIVVMVPMPAYFKGTPMVMAFMVPPVVTVLMVLLHHAKAYKNAACCPKIHNQALQLGAQWNIVAPNNSSKCLLHPCLPLEHPKWAKALLLPPQRWQDQQKLQPKFLKISLSPNGPASSKDLHLLCQAKTLPPSWVALMCLETGRMRFCHCWPVFCTMSMSQIF